VLGAETDSPDAQLFPPEQVELLPKCPRQSQSFFSNDANTRETMSAFFQILRCTTFGAVIWFACAPQLATAVFANHSRPLRPLAEWVRKTGVETVVRGHIVETMGFPPVDLPVRERGFRVTGENLTHVCSVSTAPQYADFLFLATVKESDGSALVWRVSLEGELLDAIRFFQGIAVRVPKTEDYQQFLAEKLYFLKKLQSQSGTNANDFVGAPEVAFEGACD
jgi:hypothetical protein